MDAGTVTVRGHEDVTAIIPTRGDVDVSEIVDSIIWPVVVWDNSKREDLGAYGRYKAIEETTSQIVYVQDDDCLVTSAAQLALLDVWLDHGGLVSNMRSDHNAGMPHLALPGWGAVFHRDLPAAAFARWAEAEPDDAVSDDFRRIGCDIVFPVLTRSRMVDLGHVNLAYAWDEGRTHLRVDYQEKKQSYYRRACEVRG